MPPTPMEVVGHEFVIILGMAVWTLTANIFIKYFNLPEVVPMNLIYSFTATLPTLAKGLHVAQFTWLNHGIRIMSDLGIMAIGIFAYDTMFWLYGIDYKLGQDPTTLIRRSAQFSFWTKIFMVCLIYISHLTLLGSWRLGWNAVCVPFVFLFNTVVDLLFPPPQNPPP